MRRRSRFWRSERGAVVVEFALLLPLLLTLIFAVIELGSAWYSKQMLVSASREGARLGALYDGADDAEVEAAVADLLAQAGFPGTVTVSSTGAGGDSGDLVTVSVTADHQLLVLGNLIPGLPSRITLSATTVMRHE